MKLHARYRSKPKSRKTTKPWLFSLYIGFFAGILWGALKLLQFAMKYTDVVPGFLLEPFYLHSFLLTWQGILLGYASLIVLSLAAALLYGLVLRKLRGPWPGIIYGLAWWAGLYLLVGPLTGMVPAITQMDINSLVTDMCLFAVWGLFIGYSISFEFTDERSRESAIMKAQPAK
ncbi:YqhR family membrane protein [Paenibacillus sp. YN15]|uniref:YqhR family membrane protein n=1 Tax=Paenibacillus sp. YN15 TaxID=1742774 RepID=UPI000DCD925D|nr:YqhR family membrane protein [Paenibacillus sp. YN15]RAV01000.1 hypothetical protein DQG13_13460 [Paenibacillus sp. YN15]